MKRKLFYSSAILAGALIFGPQMVMAQEEGPLPEAPPPMEDTTNGNQVMDNGQVPTDQSLTMICAEADGIGVVIALPSSTDLRTLNAYSAFCSADETATLLSGCDCSVTVNSM